MTRKHIFNRDYAVVTTTGGILMETNDKQRAERTADEYRKEGVSCDVQKCSRPMYAK